MYTEQASFYDDSPSQWEREVEVKVAKFTEWIEQMPSEGGLFPVLLSAIRFRVDFSMLILSAVEGPLFDFKQTFKRVMNDSCPEALTRIAQNMDLYCDAVPVVDRSQYKETEFSTHV